MIAKFDGRAGHVQQDFETHDRVPRHCILSSNGQCIENFWQRKHMLPDIFARHQVAKCPVMTQNVQQNAEVQPDILSCMLEVLVIAEYVQ